MASIAIIIDLNNLTVFPENLIRANEHIDTRILDIVNRLGANIVDMGEYVGIYPASWLYLASGLYDYERDKIAIKADIAISSRCSEVVLHELIHWTGHASRLNRLHKRRQISTDDDRQGIIDIEHNNIIYHTEEATAQLGMFKLAMVLGLDQFTHFKAMTDYLASYHLANMHQAETESDDAVKFILDKCSWIMNENKAA